MGVLLFSVYSLLSRDIQTAQNELNGLQMIAPESHGPVHAAALRPVFRCAQQQRSDEGQANCQEEVVEAVVAADASLSPALRENQIWKSVRQDWEEIRAQGLSWSGPDNIKRHTQMIAKALQFMAEVADANELTLDPAMDTYFFMDTVISKMPAILEQLGVTRARGTGVRESKELSPLD